MTKRKTKDSETLSDQLRNIIAGHELSRYAICKAAELDPSQMHRFSNRTGRLTTDSMDRLALFSGCDLWQTDPTRKAGRQWQASATTPTAANVFCSKPVTADARRSGLGKVTMKLAEQVKRRVEAAQRRGHPRRTRRRRNSQVAEAV